MYNSSMLGGDFSERSFLRGVQLTDDRGEVTFTTILPGRYRGRAFHIHFAVYGDAAYGDLRLTSQMGMDDDLIESLYTDAGYTEGLQNETLNSRDNIFSDGFDHQLMTVAGEVATGLSATFTAVV
jgi:protocatechuate 3,4-dioxygenase beta subunit